MNLKRFIKKLERDASAPVIVVAASWRRDIATDLDVQAARIAADFVDDVESHATVVFAARGGDSAFADHLARSFKARGLTFDFVAPTLVNGAGTLLSFAAQRILLHPHAGLGAYDAGPLRNRDAHLGPRNFDDVPALGGINYTHDLSLPVRLASGMRERRLSRALAERLAGAHRYDALSQLHLGDDLGLGADELCEAGFSAEVLDDAHLWELYGELETMLGLLTVPAPAYTEADLGDEVEFAPAVGLTGAVIANRDRVARYELDTGSPDPDTGIYQGAWMRD